MKSTANFGNSMNIVGQRRNLGISDFKGRYYALSTIPFARRKLRDSTSYRLGSLAVRCHVRKTQYEDSIRRIAVVKKITVHRSSVYCVKFSLNEKYLLTGSDDYLIKKFRVSDMRLLRSFRGHRNCLVDILTAKSKVAKQEFVISSSVDTEIRIWEIETSKCLVVLQWHTAACGPLAYTRDTLITTSDDGLTCLWDFEALIRNHYDEACVLEFEETDIDRQTSPTPAQLSKARKSGAHIPIVLPHLDEDNSKYNVNTVSKHPFCEVIATGADDGIGRIWNVDSKDHNLDSGLLEHIDDSRNSNRLSGYFFNGIRRLCCSLKAHTASISNIAWSNNGDRLLSASIKDGTVKIWKWESSSSTIEHLDIVEVPNFYTVPSTLTLHAANPAEDSLLNRTSTILPSSKVVFYVNNLLHAMSTDSDLFDLKTYLDNVDLTEEEKVELQSLLFKRSFSKEKRPTIDAATWNCDDSRIITMQSTPTRIHETSYSMDASAFSDQIMKVWCSYSGKLLYQRREHRRPCYCAITHPTIRSLVITLGHDSQVCFWNILTGTLLHKLMIPTMFGPSSLLDGVIWKNHGLGLIVTDSFGRLILLSGIHEEVPVALLGNERYFVKNKLFEETLSEQFFKDEYHPLEYDSLGFGIDSISRKSPHELDQGALCSCSLDPYSVDMNDARAVNKLVAYLDLTIFQREINAMSNMKHALDNMDLLIRLATRMDEKSVLKMLNVEVLFRNIVANNARNLRDRNVRASSLASPARDQAIMLSGSPDPDYEEPVAPIRRSERQRDRASQGQLLSFRELAEGQSRELTDNVPRSRRRAARMAGERIRRYGNLSANFSFTATSAIRNEQDDDSEFSESEHESIQEVQDPEEIIRRNRRRRRIQFEEGGNLRRSTRNTDHHTVTSTESSLESISPDTQMTTPHDVIERILSERGHLLRLNKGWLQQTTLEHAFGSYIPQLRDEVVFCGQAFEEFLGEYCPGQEIPNLGVPSLFPYVLCRVEALEYQFPNDPGFDCIVVSLKLEILATPNYSSDIAHMWSPAEERTYFRMFLGRIGSFLVLKTPFEESLRKTWSRRDPLKCYYLNQSEELTSEDGWIKAVDVYDEIRWPNSPFKSLLVAWATGDEDFRVSPWEVEGISDGLGEIIKNRVSIPENISAQLIEGFEDIISADYATPFVDPIDPDEVRDYYVLIPVPFHLRLIIDRLKNKFYRTMDMIKFDIKLILANCIEYNEVSSEITKCARKLKGSLLKCMREISRKSDPSQGRLPLREQSMGENIASTDLDNDQHPIETEVSARGRIRRKVNYNENASDSESSLSDHLEIKEISSRGRSRRKVNYRVQNHYSISEDEQPRNKKRRKTRTVHTSRPSIFIRDRYQNSNTSNQATLTTEKHFVRRSSRRRTPPNYHIPDEDDEDIAELPSNHDSEDSSPTLSDENLRRSARSRGNRISYSAYV